MEVLVHFGNASPHRGCIIAAVTAATAVRMRRSCMLVFVDLDGFKASGPMPVAGGGAESLQDLTFDLERHSEVDR